VFSESAGFIGLPGSRSGRVTGARGSAAVYPGAPIGPFGHQRRPFCRATPHLTQVRRAPVFRTRIRGVQQRVRPTPARTPVASQLKGWGSGVVSSTFSVWAGPEAFGSPSLRAFVGLSLPGVSAHRRALGVV